MGVNMKIYEFYFDYICPFCYRSFKELLELYKQDSRFIIDFHPCEIHPRPEQHGKHSDLCIQGMFLAKDLSVDLWEYNKKIFDSHFIDRIDIEDIQQLAEALKDLINPYIFVQTIQSRKYSEHLLKSNETAFITHKIEVVPHYISGNNILPSIEGVGISNEKLKEYLLSK